MVGHAVTKPWRFITGDPAELQIHTSFVDLNDIYIYFFWQILCEIFGIYLQVNGLITCIPYFGFS